MCHSKAFGQLLLASLEKRRQKTFRGITKLLTAGLGYSPFILYGGIKFSEGA
jgi:hypothetical protein